MQTQELKIPQERIAVLIGTKSEIKSRIQRATKTKLTIDSKEGDVLIQGDPIDVFTTTLIVKAIARGFNPDIALLLRNEKFALEIINITDFSGKSKKKLERLKGRVIGTRGKSRNTLENLTNTNISVYGKTVSIIGLIEDVSTSREAVEKLLQGAAHSNVYSFVEKQKSL